MTGGVGQEVAQYLYNATPVGHHPGETRRQTDLDIMWNPAAHEGIFRLVHESGHRLRFRGHRQRAGLYAHHVQEFADQFPHPVGL